MLGFKAAAGLLAAASVCGALAARAAAQEARAAKYEPATGAAAAGVNPDEVRVEFEGNRVFASEQLRSLAAECVARHSRTAKSFDPEVLDYCLRRDVVNHMRRAGYLRAEVGEPRPAPHGVGLSVPVEERELYRLGRVRIEGAAHFDARRLRGLLPLRRGDIADGAAVVRWLGEHLKRMYADEGFIQYEYDVEPEYRLEPGAGEGVVNLSVTVNEGRQFRLRRLAFRAEGYVPEEALRGAFGIKEGEVFSAREFGESVRRLNGLDLFDPDGRFEDVDGDGDVNFQADEETGGLDIVIRLRERGREPPAGRAPRADAGEGVGRPGRPGLVRRP